MSLGLKEDMGWSYRVKPFLTKKQSEASESNYTSSDRERTTQKALKSVVTLLTQGFAEALPKGQFRCLDLHSENSGVIAAACKALQDLAPSLNISCSLFPSPTSDPSPITDSSTANVGPALSLRTCYFLLLRCPSLANASACSLTPPRSLLKSLTRHSKHSFFLLPFSAFRTFYICQLLLPDKQLWFCLHQSGNLRCYIHDT